MFIKLIVTSPAYSFLVCPEKVTTNWEAYTHKHVFSHSSGSLMCKIKVLARSHSLPRLLGRLLVSSSVGDCQHSLACGYLPCSLCLHMASLFSVSPLPRRILVTEFRVHLDNPD